MGAISLGLFKYDTQMLIPTAEPLEEAIGLCKRSINREIIRAKQDREDFQNDYNFLMYLKSLWGLDSHKKCEMQTNNFQLKNVN